MNKLVIIGNLTRDPELAETASGISFAKFTVAVTRNYTNSDGERETDFFDINVNGEGQVKAYINRLKLTKSEKEKLLKYSGYGK